MIAAKILPKLALIFVALLTHKLSVSAVDPDAVGGAITSLKDGPQVLVKGNPAPDAALMVDNKLSADGQRGLHDNEWRGLRGVPDSLVTDPGGKCPCENICDCCPCFCWDNCQP